MAQKVAPKKSESGTKIRKAKVLLPGATYRTTVENLEIEPGAIVATWKDAARGHKVILLTNGTTVEVVG